MFEEISIKDNVLKEFDLSNLFGEEFEATI
jgi:hypothetical protein